MPGKTTAGNDKKRKASMKSAERIFINFETIIKKYLTKDITFINK